MNAGKQVLLDALRKHHSDAMTTAKELREIAKRQTSKEEADLYLQQAHEEETKSQGYLRQAEILAEAEE
jgi:hypothetical protein